MNYKIFANKVLAYLSFLLKLEKSPAKPLLWQIEPTNACMMNCVMCPRKNMKRKVGFMDLNLFKKIIDQAKYNDHLLMHHYGDPLIHPKIDEMIRYVRSKGIIPGMSVNPKLLTRKMCERLIDAGLGVIIISLDGIDDKTYKYYRGKEANYDEAVKNINTLIEVKREKNSDLYVEVQMIKMKKTKGDTEKFEKLWNKDGVNKVAIKPFITFDGSDQEIINQADEETLSKKFKEKQKPNCSWPWVSLVVMWDGKVVTCCYDYDGKYVVGDLNKESLREIWNNKKMRLIRRQIKNNELHQNPLCKTCFDTRNDHIGERIKEYLKEMMKEKHLPEKI